MTEDNINDLLEIGPDSDDRVIDAKDQKAFTRLFTIIMIVYNLFSIFIFYSVMASSPGMGRGMALGFFVAPFIVISLILLVVFLLIKRKQFQFSKHWLLTLLTTPIILIFLIVTFGL